MTAGRRHLRLAAPAARKVAGLTAAVQARVVCRLVGDFGSAVSIRGAELAAGQGRRVFELSGEAERPARASN